MKMTTRTTLAVVAAAGAVAATAAFAEMGPGGMMGGHGGMGGGAMLLQEFDTLDADKDGKVTPAEIAAQRQARFAAADANGTPAVYWMTQDFNATGRRLYDRIGKLTPFIRYSR